MHHPINKRMTYTVLVDRDHTFSHFIFPPKGVKIQSSRRNLSIPTSHTTVRTVPYTAVQYFA